MSRYRFSLQQVLDLKASLKRQMTYEIASLEKQERDVQQRIERLSKQWEHESAALAAEMSALKAAEYRMRVNYLQYLNQQIETERRKLFQIAGELANKRQKFIQLSREETILEKLRERREKEYHKQVRRREQKELDEVAARRLVQHADESANHEATTRVNGEQEKNK